MNKREIKETYYRAYKDLLETHLNEKKYDWIIKLHAEIVTRLCKLVPRRTDIHDEIAEHLDPVLFRQQLESNTYKGEDLYKLITYVYSWLQRLCAPSRDDEIKESLNEVLDSMKTETFGKIVPNFILSVHHHIDWIEEDICKFKALQKAKSSQK